MPQYYNLPSSYLEILASLFILFITLFFVIKSAKYGKSLTAALFAATFARAITATFRRFDFIIPAGRNDVLAFEATATAWANSGCLNLWEHFNPSASYVYSFVVGNIYGCMGRLPLIPHFLNVFLSVASVYYIARTAGLLWGKQAMVRAAWIAALFPTLIWYSTTLIRESFVVFGLCVGVFYAVKWVSNNGIFSFFASVMGFLFASLFHGGIVVAIAALFIFAIWGMVRDGASSIDTRRVSISGLISGVLIGISLVIFIIVGSGARFSKIGTVSDLEAQLDTVEIRSEGGAQGGAAYPAYLATDSTIGIITLTPVRMLYHMFGPPIWDIRAPQHAIAFADGLLWLVLCSIAWRNREILRERRDLQLVLLIFLFLALAFAWGTNNFGTGLRHKAKYFPLLLIFVVGLLKFRKFSFRLIRN